MYHAATEKEIDEYLDKLKKGELETKNTTSSRYLRDGIIIIMSITPEKEWKKIGW